MLIKVDDENCVSQATFRIKDNKLEIETVDDSEEEVTMSFSEENTRKIIKWLIHATNYRS